MTRAQFLGILAASVLLFAFVTGPVWRHPGDIGVLDWAILYSYCAIPPLVAGCLLVSRRFSVRGFLLDTLALTLTKYVVTSLIAIVLWSTVAPPRGAPPAPRAPDLPPVPELAIVPTPIDPARTGTVRATVVDAAGQPLAGALVFVAQGLEDDVFAPPDAPVVLDHGPDGVEPSLAAAQVGQRIEARSTDGRMHTLVARRDGEVLFNVPLLAKGAPTTTRVRDAAGMWTLRCNAHTGERTSRLLVLAHPFFARTDAAGRADLPGVPAGRLRIGVAYGEHGAGEAPADLPPQGSVDVRIVAAP
jgi:plastocyanin